MRDRSRLTVVGQKVVRGVEITFWRICSWFFFGVLYCGIEILWRGYSHWTMGVLACVICIPLDIANDTVIPWETPLWLQAIIGGTIITESTLSFLGLGVKHPLATWGTIINSVSSASAMAHYPFIWIPVGLLICMTVIAFNFVGDGLRDAYDPKAKR